MTETPVPRMGSIKNKVVASDLEDERKNRNFDQQELTHLFWNGADNYIRAKGIMEDFNRVEILRGSEKWYDMSREEQQENALARLRAMYDNYPDKYFKSYKQHMTPWWTLGFQGLVRTTLYSRLFRTPSVSLSTCSTHLSTA